MDLQFITHYTHKYSYYDSAQMALEGGCRWIQLRMKDAGMDELEKEAIRIQALCREYHATFIIDDHVELAKRLNADGVHVGKMDIPVAKAREILGQGYIIGGTANTVEDVIAHRNAGADYVGCGPFRFTTTKKNLSPILGLEGYKTIIKQLKANHIMIPLIAIGGIVKEDIPMLAEIGVAGIAVSGTILRAEDPVKEMKELIQLTTGN